jgi:hypothetical protein
MLSPTDSLNALAAQSTFTLNAPSSSTTTDSFAQQLAATLETYLGTGSNASSVQVNIQSTGSQTSGNRQFLVTVTSPQATTTPPSTPSTSTTPTSAPVTTTPASTTPPTTTPTPPATPPTTEEDAYWAMQPPAVQALRTITDETARTTLAQQLAAQGYTIDVPIMVWKWDPLITMTIRQNSGYTWVPSGDQPNVPTCPNCDLPGLPAYDPNNPPAGSIAVSTAFAKGLESTAPWGFTG